MMLRLVTRSSSTELTGTLLSANHGALTQQIELSCPESPAQKVRMREPRESHHQYVKPLSQRRNQ